MRRVLLAAVAALTVGLGAVSLITGFSASPAVRVIQALAVFAAGAAIIGGAVVLALVHLAGWREPESEQEFEAIVQRAERLAAQGVYAGAATPGVDDEVDEADPRTRSSGRSSGRRSTSCRSSSIARWSTWRSSSPTAAGAGTPTACTRATPSRRTTSTTGS